jgi:hypothetical protein
MSHARSMASSSSNLQLIFNNALQLYEKRTKINLLAHPLAAQLQSCDTPGTIITLLREQVQIQAQDDKLTKWLDPIVNVLHTLSVSLGGVSLVCLDTILEICILFQLQQVITPAKVIFTGIGVLLSVRILLNASAQLTVTTTMSFSGGERKSGEPSSSD